MAECNKISWWTLFFGAVGLAIGYYLNTLANRKLLEDLKAELQNINQQENLGRSTPELERRKYELEGAIKILQK